MSKSALTNKIRRVEIDIDKLERVGITKLSDLDDFMNYHVIERLIEKIVDAAVDINQMILREKFLASIKTAKESFTDLASFGVLEKTFAQTISLSVGLRNKIIHEYEKVEQQTLFDSIAKCQEQYTEYCKQLIFWIDKNYN